ncbi:MAG: transglutaminase N-terminal domain-containing protein, partial [Sphingobium sp.]
MSIRHETCYRFREPVPYALQRVRLIPRNSPAQKILSWGIELDGAVCEAEYDDQHGNRVVLLRAVEGTEAVSITCRGEVETDPDFRGITGEHSGYAPLWLFRQPTTLTRAGQEILGLASKIRSAEHADDIAMLHALSAAVLKCVSYRPGATDVGTTAEEAVRLGKGVCQDQTHVFFAAARALGFPARYGSGYLFMYDKRD